MRTLLAFLVLSSVVAADDKMTVTASIGNSKDFPVIWLDGPNGNTLEITSYAPTNYITTNGIHPDYANMTFLVWNKAAGNLPEYITPLGIGYGERTYQTGVDPWYEFVISIHGLDWPFSEYSYSRTAPNGTVYFATTPDLAYPHLLEIDSITLDHYGSTWPMSWASGTYVNPRIHYQPTVGEGDLNQDGSVDAIDAAKLFGNWTGDSFPSVPEPVGASWMLLLGATHLVYRHGKSPVNRG